MKLKFLIVLVALLLGSVAVDAQDLLARQAPVDHRVKMIDTLALRDIMEREIEETFGFDLYGEWDNTYAHKQQAVPETFKIDLRGFCMRTLSRAITSDFGPRWKRAHKGIDIKVYVGDTIRAAFDGKVRIVRYEAKGYGKYIVIRHNNGLETIYGHLSKQLVSENQEVKAGDVIGLGGNTGRSTGSHLHFETRLCGLAINPAIMFDFRAQDVVSDYYVFNKRTYEQEGVEANRLRGKIGNGGYTPEDVRGPGAKAPDPATQRASSGSSPSYHKVKAGETLSSIAKRRGVSLNTLYKLNKLNSKSTLRVGQIIRYS